MSTVIQQIFSKLQIAIRNIMEVGDNNNRKIDTRNERNQIAKLLAGAEQEIGDFFQAKQTEIDNEKLTAAERNEMQHVLEKEVRKARGKLDVMKKALIETAPITEEYNPKSQAFQNINGFKHRYVDGKYDVKSGSLADAEGYKATVFDSNGNEIGIKVYKNDKEVYANREFAAKQLGLLSSKDKSGMFKRIIQKILYYPTFGHSMDGDFTPILKDLSPDEYYDASSGWICKWDNKTHSFHYYGKQVLMDPIFNKPVPVIGISDVPSRDSSLESLNNAIDELNK